jgi:hypothetical protein
MSAAKPKSRPKAGRSILPTWRQLASGAWECGDPSEDFFRFRTWTGFGFDLVDYDGWLGALPACAARDDLLRQRSAAKAEMDSQRMKALVYPMWLARKAIEREAVLLPLSEIGKRFSGGRPPGPSEATKYLLETRRPGETARELHGRLSALGLSDGKPIYFDRIGDAIMIETRTNKPISYEAFEKRLIPRKRKEAQ